LTISIFPDARSVLKNSFSASLPFSAFSLPIFTPLLPLSISSLFFGRARYTKIKLYANAKAPIAPPLPALFFDLTSP